MFRGKPASFLLYRLGVWQDYRLGSRFNRPEYPTFGTVVLSDIIREGQLGKINHLGSAGHVRIALGVEEILRNERLVLSP